MFLIVVHHGIVHGLGLDGLAPSGGPLIMRDNDVALLSVVNSFLIFAVNTFVIISGYFAIKFSVQKLAKVLIPTAFFTLLFTSLPFLMHGEGWGLAYSFLFLSHGPYWFITCYVFLMFLTPLINVALEQISRKQFHTLLIGLFIINCYFGFWWNHRVNDDGYTLMQFIFMYVVGRYIRLYNVRMKSIPAFALYVFSSLATGLLFVLQYRRGHADSAWSMTFYNNPLLIVSAISFFLMFLNFDIKSRYINKIASSALAIYLFQNTTVCSDLYYRLVSEAYTSETSFFNGSGILLYIALLALAICIISILLNTIQEFISKPLHKMLLR